MQQEREEKAFRDSIQNFHKDELKHSVPAEKVNLPDATSEILNMFLYLCVKK